ncbi:MAG: OsmC family protein [Solirubrobacterales bacterium]
MDSQQLKAIQSPLKDSYREDAARALVTLNADAQLNGEAVACSVQTGRALVEAGLHPASGGDGSLACSGDMLLQALVACAGVTLRSVAVNRGIEVRGGTVRASGDLDFRGTMAVDRDTPVGFRAIRLAFELDSDADDEQLDELIAITERYCVVLQTLANSPELVVSRAA